MFLSEHVQKCCSNSLLIFSNTPNPLSDSHQFFFQTAHPSHSLGGSIPKHSVCFTPQQTNHKFSLRTWFIAGIFTVSSNNLVTSKFKLLIFRFFFIIPKAYFLLCTSAFNIIVQSPTCTESATFLCPLPNIYSNLHLLSILCILARFKNQIGEAA